MRLHGASGDDINTFLSRKRQCRPRLVKFGPGQELVACTVTVADIT